MALRTAQFLSLLLVAIALIPAGAHLASLPAKIGLPVDRYYTVQAIYQGWALFGILQVAAVLSTVAMAWFSRGMGMPFVLAIMAAVLMAATLVVFFAFVFPANQATANWTNIPDNWEQLRVQWEYGHAFNAGLTMLAFLATALSVLKGPREP